MLNCVLEKAIAWFGIGVLAYAKAFWPPPRYLPRPSGVMKDAADITTDGVAATHFFSESPIEKTIEI